MSPPEVWWRLGNKFQEVADRCAAPLRRRPIRLDRIAGRNGQRMLHDAGALGASLPEKSQWDSRIEVAKAALLERAERLRHNRLTLFDREYLVRCERGNLLLRVDSGLAVRLYTGSKHPILGGVSRGYHRKEATLVGRCAAHGTCRWTTRIPVELAGSEGTSAARQTMVNCDGTGQEATEVGRHGK